jgi:hypothetical protein
MEKIFILALIFSAPSVFADVLKDELNGAWQPKSSICVETKRAVPINSTVEQYVFDSQAQTVQLGLKDQECDIAVKYDFKYEKEAFSLSNPRRIRWVCPASVDDSAPDIDMSFEFKRNSIGETDLVILIPAGSAPECGLGPREVTLVRIPAG